MRLSFSLFILILSINTFAQVKIDSLKIQGKWTNFYSASESDSLFYGSVFFSDKGQIYKNQIYIYDKEINLIDSIDRQQSGRNGINIAQLFSFNGSNYSLALDQQFNCSANKIDGNSLVDSSSFGIDTLFRSSPVQTWHVGPNALRVLLYEQEVNSQFIKRSKIVDLDSNFHMTAYHAFDFDSISRRSNSVITGVNFVNDSIWHIYTNRPSGALHVYNPITHTIDSSHYLWNEIRSCHQLTPNEYLAIGIVSWSPTVLGLPYTGMDALGFYRMNGQGLPTDTSYFLNIDHNAPGTLDFSFEDMDVPAVIVYDTNNIYLACESSYTANQLGSKQEGYLFVVKTDSRGNEHWRYRWGGTYKISSVRGLITTPDSGCIVVGNYAYEFPKTGNLAMILIKLGPDGNISNVELDAPENLVQFYPNPIKNKLSYSYLPEANGRYTLEIVNMNGQPVQHAQLENAEHSIPVELQSGFYLYHLKDESGKVVQVGKLVVE